MIPVKLKIEGFLSYQQPVELDFSTFSLACISGPNGAGKSSLLDAITWALFGQARKRDESVINNHPSVSSAQVTLDFDYEGNRYRVQRVNPRSKTSAVEFFIWSTAGGGDEGRWKPLTERTLRETDKKIEDTLRMDFDTFTNASFFLQGKADQFATARPADRKRILSNILGLEIWESYRDAASQRRRDLEKDVKALDGRLSEIQTELDEGPERKERLAALQAQLAELTKQRQERAVILENVRRMRAALAEQAKLLATYQTQIENITFNCNRIQSTLEARLEEKSAYEEILGSAEEIETAYQDWQAARTALEAMEELAAQFRQREALRHEPLRVIEAEEARLKTEQKSLLEQRTNLEKSLSELPMLEERLGTAREKIKMAEQKLSKRGALQEAVQQLQAQQADAKAENPRLRDEMDEIKSRIDQLKTTEGVECPLCGQPLTKDEREALIKSLTKEGTALGDRYRVNIQLLEDFEGKLNQMGSELADLNGVDAELRSVTRQADQLEHQIENLRAQQNAWGEGGAVRLAELSAILESQSFALDVRERLRQIDDELSALGYDLAAHENLRQAEAAGRQAEGDLRKLEGARAALAPIEREITELEVQLVKQEQDLAAMTAAHTEAAAQYAAAEADLPDLQQAETDLHDIQEGENRIRMQVGGAQQTVDVLDTLKERKAALLEEREGMTQRIADLKQLERAFGKDGIPALLIEQALPEISESTNTLLSRLTNGRMSFNFLTQREYKDTNREDRKETLDIVISDNLGERDYEMFSGGEAFRVNFSIRLALSQVLARRAGARLQTLVIDEGFGSQDAQGRQRLIEAINLVRDDFEKVLVITHLDELKDVFPTRIEVEKTPEGSQLQVV
jgi:DNA repair protein SbcC/Rad50